MLNPMLGVAMKKLLSSEHPFKTANTLAYLIQNMGAKINAEKEIYEVEAKKYAKLDDKGGFIVARDEDGKIVPNDIQFKDEESKEEFYEFKQAWFTKLATFKKEKISVKELGDVNLSPVDISALAPLFSDLDD